MNAVVTVILIAAVSSILLGVLTALIPLLSLGNRGGRPRRPIMMNTGPVYWSFTVWTIGLGVVLMLAPKDWYGPTWSYFPQLPHNGFGMGLCLTLLSSVQAVALWREASARVLGVLFFLNGFVYWTAGIILAAEGLLGHQGLAEVPFILYTGAHAFAQSAALTAHHKEQL